MKVPLLDLKEQYRSCRDELLPELERLFDSQLFILGQSVREFEDEIASYCHVPHGIGVASGSDALLLSLMALEAGPGDEVITTPYTFFSTASAITRLGARPVFVDIDPVTYNIDPAAIEDKVTSRTRGILPVHLYGQVAGMERISSIASKYHLFVVEDAAQAIGAEYGGKRAGALGDAGCLSFFPSKNLGGFGDGGMVVTDDAGLAEKISILRVHGMKPKYVHKYVGINSRLDALQAVVLSVKLKRLDACHEARLRHAGYYLELFKSAGLVRSGDVVPPQDRHGGDPAFRHVYNQYVIRARKRDALREYLLQGGVGTEVYYPIPLHLQECFAGLGYREGDFPEAERAARETLALPVYPELTGEMQEYVVERIASFYRGRRP
ncbi:MAG: DegT/DnrJ/EryC1/StrS family aminotransferase [Deltaproteobacteria bacterium]|nr:DegT/DnrJ/EryC1/StrS family aminotransferase [Deltaproteobacteria bacterium]